MSHLYKYASVLISFVLSYASGVALQYKQCKYFMQYTFKQITIHFNG